MNVNLPDFSFLIETVEAASIKILEYYNGVFEVDFKRGREPVTLADKAADEIIIKHLLDRFPSDAILTEEHGLVTPKGPGNGRAWYVDPIDGTAEFIKKNGDFAVQIGLSVQGVLQSGIVYKPTTQDLYAAEKGKGAFHRSTAGVWTRLRIPKRVSGQLIVAMSRSHPSSLAQRVGNQLGLTGHIERGGVGLKLMAIVAGEAHYYMNDSNSTKIWDLAAPQILFTEAGGAVTDLRGKPFSYNPQDPYHRHGVLASCDSLLHIELLGRVNF